MINKFKQMGLLTPSVISLLFISIFFAEISSPGHKFYFLSFIFYIPFFYLLYKHKNNWFSLSLIFGLIYNFVYFRWLIYPFQYSEINLFFAYLTLFLLSLALTCFFLIFTYFFVKFEKPVFLASIFTILEIIKGVLFTGFPWGDLSYNFYKFKPFLKTASYLGSYFISFSIILVNIVIFFMIFKKKINYIFYILSIALIIFSINIFYKPVKNYIEKKVLIVQGNISEKTKMDEKKSNYVINEYEKLTLASLKKEKVDLIIWPETVYTKFLNEDKKLRDSFLKFIGKIKKLIILGIPAIDFYDKNQYKIFNSLYFFINQNKYLRYDKVHLVPFGEYTPFKSIFSFINKIVPGEDFSKGEKLKILNFNEYKIIPLICFEGIFPFQIMKLNLLKGNLIVNISNEAWFGKSFSLDQHLAINCFRAAESRKYFLKAANTGISAIISPNGKLLKVLKPYKKGVITGKIKLINEVSFYDRYGYFINSLYFIIFFIGIFQHYFLRKKTRLHIWNTSGK